MIVGPLRTGRSQAIKNSGFGLLKIGELQNGFGRPFALHLALLPFETASIAVANSMILISISYPSAFLGTNLEWSNLDEWPKSSRE
jgi:hypothetical protein